MIRRSLSIYFFKGFGVGGGGSGRGLGGSIFNALGGAGQPLGGLFNKALEWCSTAHAQDIARQEGIELRDIKFESTPDGGVRVVVDAPNASQQQIEQLGRRVEVECPVARFRSTQVVGGASSPQGMKWLRAPDKYDR